MLLFYCLYHFYPCRYYKVNEVQKFTFSKKKDESQNDITVGITIGWEIFEDKHINGKDCLMFTLSFKIHRQCG